MERRSFFSVVAGFLAGLFGCKSKAKSHDAVPTAVEVIRYCDHPGGRHAALLEFKSREHADEFFAGLRKEFEAAGFKRVCRE